MRCTQSYGALANRLAVAGLGVGALALLDGTWHTRKPQVGFPAPGRGWAQLRATAAVAAP
ncbi:MAG: hypothetical protein GEV04_16430 [Actinophytocola sp.]|nr:hypothetical protein [Actinophytocola sp.]